MTALYYLKRCPTALRTIVFFSVALFLVPLHARAQGTANTGAPTGEAPEADRRDAQENLNREFLGIRFGVGFGMSMDFGSQRVDEAEVVDGIVRVTRTTNHRPRILLETHYFWEVDSEDVSVPFGDRTVTVKGADIGFGPFVAIQGSDEEVLEAFAMGAMIGFRRDARSSFNIGIGVVLDPDVKVFGDGIRPNEPLPDGETAIRFTQQPRWGYLTLVSFSF